MENKTVDEKLQLTELIKDEQREISGGMAELAEASSFTTISNIMKTKQDTAKNSINNLR